MSQDQNHPLYLTDRDHVNRLISKPQPSNSDLIDLARLLIRYEDFPGAQDIKLDLEKLMRLWKLNRKELNDKTLEIWKNGFNPSTSANETIGSGFDTSDSTNP